MNNVVSGLILAWDKTIRYRDVIELDDGFVGQISKLSLRFTQIVNRDHVEVLVPNSVLISKALKNYTHSSKIVRLDVELLVRWEDFEKASKIAEKACLRVGRVLPSVEYKPKTFFVRQTDGACLLRIAFWIETPDKGISNVKSEVFREIIRALNINKITLPLPQQAVHVLDAGRSDRASRTAALRSTRRRVT